MGMELGDGLIFGLNAEEFRNLKMGDTVLYRKIENGIVSRATAEVVLASSDGEKCLIIIRSDYYVIQGKEILEIGKEFLADKSELRLFE
jgi:hypothetical protein